MRPIRKSGRPSPECPDEEGRIEGQRRNARRVGQWAPTERSRCTTWPALTYPLIELFSALAPVLPTPTSSTVDSYTLLNLARRVSILARQSRRWPSRSLMHSNDRHTEHPLGDTLGKPSHGLVHDQTLSDHRCSRAHSTAGLLFAAILTIALWNVALAEQTLGIFQDAVPSSQQ